MMCDIFFTKYKRKETNTKIIFFKCIYIYDKINITLLGHNLFDFYFVHVISYHTLRRFNVTLIINIMPFQVFY